MDQPAFGPFRDLLRLSAGHTAEVFVARLATGPESGVHVVLKRALPSAAESPATRAAFLREGRLARASAACPELVHLLGDGEHHGLPYLVYEYRPGWPLAELRDRLTAGAPPLPLAATAHVGATVARALAWMHAALADGGGAPGHLHQDVAPRNILVTPDGTVRLTDLGSALPLGADATCGPRQGTPGYAAPELARPGPVDGRADLFSLGVVLAELVLARRAPLLASRTAGPPSPDGVALAEALASAPDASFADLLRPLLAPDPAGRPASARDVATALATFADAGQRGLAEWAGENL